MSPWGSAGAWRPRWQPCPLVSSPATWQGHADPPGVGCSGGARGLGNPRLHARCSAESSRPGPHVLTFPRCGSFSGALRVPCAGLRFRPEVCSWDQVSFCTSREAGCSPGTCSPWLYDTVALSRVFVPHRVSAGPGPSRPLGVPGAVMSSVRGQTFASFFPGLSPLSTESRPAVVRSAVRTEEPA